MSLTYGFYNSVNNDRVYNAEQVSSIFDGLVNDGIYMSIGGKMMVKINSGMILKISSGRAWFNHTWSYNDSDYNITLDPADPLLNRIDAIVLEINRSNGIRANSFKIIKGTAATNPSRPTLTHNVNVNQYALAYVTVSAGSSEISQANITNVIGTSETPYVKGIIENISIDDMVAQWQTQFNQWMAAISAQNTQWTNEQHAAWQTWITAQETAFTNWATEYQEEMENFRTTQQSAFTTWFNAMKGQLTTDAAGHLQLEIDDINDAIDDINDAINTKVGKTGDTMTGDLNMTNGGYFKGPAQLSGQSTSETPPDSNNSTRIATTAYVMRESNKKQNKISYSTTDLTAGTSTLTTGELYAVYE